MRTLITFIALVALGALRLSAVATSVPLGVVYASQEAFFDLVYRNESASPVQIQQVKPRCDCITILTHPETVAAGAVARIPCVYRSAIPGTVQTVVEIFGADPAKPHASFTVTGFVAEKSWLVSAPELLARASGQTVLVDVRSAEEFSRAHPPRSLNVPLFSLKTRAALRQQKLVLIDEGFAPESLLAEALKLRAQGFIDVAVLSGGLPSWVRARGPVEGLGRSAVQLATISAAKFDRSNAVNPWLYVEVGGSPKNPQYPNAGLHVSNLEELQKKLAEPSWPVSGGAPFHPVLIAAANTQEQARIESRFAQNPAQPIYYLEGGTAALEAYRTEQAALAQHSDETFISRPAASQVVSRPMVSGRCGSCGR